MTLLDQTMPWWSGLADFAQHFGHAPDLDAVRRVAIHLVVGAEDTETEVIRVPEDHPLWVPGAERQGATRIARIEALAESLRANGITALLDVVPGVGHSAEDTFAATEAFLEARLRA